MTWWVAIIAIATVVQAAAVVTAALLLKKTTERTQSMLDYMERELPPLVEHVSRLVAHADDLTERISRAEIAAEQTAIRVADGLTRARRWALTRVWPVLGAVSAARAMVSALRGGANGRPRGRRADELAEARFVYEGGAHARDVS